MNTYACVSLILRCNYASTVSMELLIAPAGSCFITNCVFLLPTLIVNYINAYTQLFINKILLFALIRAKYLNYNLALVKIFNGHPVTLSRN